MWFVWHPNIWTMSVSHYPHPFPSPSISLLTFLVPAISELVSLGLLYSIPTISFRITVNCYERGFRNHINRPRSMQNIKASFLKGGEFLNSLYLYLPIGSQRCNNLQNPSHTRQDRHSQEKWGPLDWNVFFSPDFRSEALGTWLTLGDFISLERTGTFVHLPCVWRCVKMMSSSSWILGSESLPFILHT